MPRRSAKTDIIVDRFWPIDVITNLADEAGSRSEKDAKKRYKSIVLRFDSLNAMRLSIALQRIFEQLEDIEEKISLTIMIDETTTHKGLRMTATVSDR